MCCGQCLTSIRSDREEEEQETFESVSSGASLSYPKQAGTIRKGQHVVIKGFPCKVIEITTSKTGKHGHAKANIVAVDIFTGKKYEDICPTSHNLVNPRKSTYLLTHNRNAQICSELNTLSLISPTTVSCH